MTFICKNYIHSYNFCNDPAVESIIALKLKIMKKVKKEKIMKKIMQNIKNQTGSIAASHMTIPLEN